MSVINTKLSYFPATETDIPAIFEMSKKLIDTYEDTWDIDYEKVLAWVNKKISQNVSSYTCVKVDGIKAGYFRFAADGAQMELDDLYILPEFRGQGIGTAVLQQCIAKAELPIYLYVFRRNTGAIKLYSRMGFEISEEVGKTRFIMRRKVDRRD